MERARCASEFVYEGRRGPRLIRCERVRKHKTHGATVGKRSVTWLTSEARMRPERVLDWSRHELRKIEASLADGVITNEDAIRSIAAIQGEADRRLDLEITLLVGTPAQRKRQQLAMDKFMRRMRASLGATR